MEKFCLKWNDFQDNITTSYKNLRESSDFSDVTLVCEDNQQVEAHRVILSACSPFFMNVLKRNKHSHPMIYMRGLKGHILMGIVDFIYNGEANIYQEDLDQFLALAEELQLKGLTGNSQEEPKKVFAKHNNLEFLVEKANFIPQNPIKEIKIKEDDVEVPLEDYGTVAIPDVNTSKVAIDNVDALDEQITNMMHKVEGSSEWSCSVCGKNSKLKANIRQHIEANHIEGVSHACNQCGKVSRSRHGLSQHMLKGHSSK